MTRVIRLGYPLQEKPEKSQSKILNHLNLKNKTNNNQNNNDQI
jgi:hypothetical protein